MHAGRQAIERVGRALGALAVPLAITLVGNRATFALAGLSLAGPARMRLRPYPVRENKREGVLVLEFEPRRRR